MPKLEDASPSTGASALDSSLDAGNSDEGNSAAVQKAEAKAISANISKTKLDTQSKQFAAEGIKALMRKDYMLASAQFNRALKMDVQNSYLQFLNGTAYHLRALQGDSESFALAEQGYTLAGDFDKSNWISQFYLGQLYMDGRRYRQAQDAFAKAALLQPRNSEVLYQLAAASYYAQDPASAEAALLQIMRLDNAAGKQPRLLQALAITSAATNRQDRANEYLQAYQSISRDSAGAARLTERVADWRQFYANAEEDEASGGREAQYRDAQFVAPEAPTPPATPEMNAPPLAAVPGAAPDMNAMPQAGQPFGIPLPTDQQYQIPAQEQNKLAEFADTTMVMVDVAIIGTEDDVTDSRGINLLSGLRLQFGNPFKGISSLEYTSDKETHTDENINDDLTRTITRAIGIPAISYSLNIANSGSARNEILARPSLVAVAGETSEFFSGVDVNASAVSGAAGDSIRVEKEIGVKLQISPQILPDNMVKLKVNAERTFLTQPSTSVQFQYRLDTTKTSVNASVAMKFGETLILSGLSETSREVGRDGVPGVQDVPGIKYLFSKSTKRKFEKSVLILLTPRRPQYVNSAPTSKMLGKMEKKERDIERLAMRQRDWFQPDANVSAIFRHLRSNALYEEFRTGDYETDDWANSPSHMRRMNMATQNLYGK